MQDSANQPGFLFHDYETFGTSPSLDRPSQFAAIRTDEDLNVVGEPEVFYCRLADDYLPQPQAVMVTGITPQEANAKGDNEAAFARRVHDLFTVPKTCIVGYNNVRFDDEVTRNIFYRNFYDPYAWSWQHDNSRWDLLDVMRACYALRPEGINWPENDEGLPSFRLEHLTVANGIEHSNAHDAMADVYATIAMAKLVKTQQPRLFDYLYAHRNKRKLATLIDVPQIKPLVHVSGMFGAARGNTSLVAPLAWHPDNRNAVIMVDLAGDIASISVRCWRSKIPCARRMLTDWASISSAVWRTPSGCGLIHRCARKWWRFMPKRSRLCRPITSMHSCITAFSAMPTARR